MKRKGGYYRVKTERGWEIAKWQLSWWWTFGSSAQWKDEDFEEIDETRINEVPIEDQWISVEEKLPDFDGQVIVAFVSGETRARFFNFQKKTFYMDDVNLNLIVTHWMPLPTSPKDTEQLKEK